MEIISFYLQANLYLVLLLVSYQMGVRKQMNFLLSRVYLSSGTILALLLPFVQLEYLHFTEAPLSSVYELSQEIDISSVSTESSNVLSPLSVLLFIYCIGIAINTIRLCFGFIKIALLLKTSEKQEGYYLLKDSSEAFSFFNYIFIGDTLNGEEKVLILKHESIHKNKKHSLDLLFASLLEIVFWFNPLVYKLKKFYTEVHEFEADSFVQENKTDYINLLLSQYLNKHQLSLLLIHQFNSNHLKQRIMRLKKAPKPSIPYFTVMASAAAFLFCFALNQQVFGQQAKSKMRKESNSQVDKPAEFPGGASALADFMQTEVDYPKELKEKGIEGRIFIEIVVEKDGSTSSYKVVKKGNPSLEQAALDACKKMPTWEPAIKNGKAVASKLILPFNFLPTPPGPPAPPKAPKAPKMPRKSK